LHRFEVREGRAREFLAVSVVHVRLDFLEVLVTGNRGNLEYLRPASASRIRHNLRRPWLAQFGKPA
jgi:hypothetical protein